MGRTKEPDDIPNTPGAAIVVNYLNTKNKRSRSTYLYSLHKVARHLGAENAYYFDWSKLRYKDTTAIRAWLLDNYEATTAHGIIAAIKGILEAAYNLELISGDDYMRAIKPKVSIKDNTKPVTGRMLSPEEIDALLETCKTGPRVRGIRDAAIILLLVGCGMRREEITTLDYSEFNRETGQLIVHGKGSKPRTNYLTNGVRSALDEWLMLRGEKPGPLFLNISQADAIVERGLDKETVYLTLVTRQKLARVEHFTVHDMRRTCISNLLLAGVDPITVANIVGHTSVATTMKYDRRGETRKIDALGLLHIPFKKRGEL